MEIGFITDGLGRRPFTEALDVAADLGLSSVEVATGNWSEAPHCDLPSLVASEEARAAFADAVTSRGLRISAFNANGNVLHPVSGAAHDRVVRDSIELAAQLGVPTVVAMSGLPAARGDSVPNWITNSWPPENLDVLEYQWEVAIPYWRELAAFAAERGVRIAIEACGEQLVHNVESMLRLLDALPGDTVAVNLDPSHLMWQGADIPTVIRAFGERIIHVHAKDIRIDAPIATRNGILDAHPMADAKSRAWNYVALGLGHPDGVTFWANFVYLLRSVGYDGTLNIEHEDVLMGSEEGVRRAAALLRSVLLVERPDWKPADV